MERNIPVDWPAIVEEARRRRKERKLTLRRLAAQANISLPTVLRFEKNQQDIQLSSALAILNVLGMVAKDIDGAALVKRVEGGFEVRFAPNAGAARALAALHIQSQAGVQAVLEKLGADADRIQIALADALRSGWGSVANLRVAARVLAEIWPQQFGSG